MRELYKQFFYKDKGTKPTDSVFMTRITVSIFGILACLFAMAFSAYGFFSVSTHSIKNVIKSSHFDVKITATNKSTGETTVLSGDTITAEAGAQYTITLVYNETDDMATTGFCRIEVSVDGEENKIYHTAQLGADKNAPNGQRQRLVLNLKFNQNADVKFISHWGTSKNYNYDEQNGFYITETNFGIEVGTVHSASLQNSQDKAPLPSKQEQKPQTDTQSQTPQTQQNSPVSSDIAKTESEMASSENESMPNESGIASVESPTAVEENLVEKE